MNINGKELKMTKNYKQNYYYYIFYSNTKQNVWQQKLQKTQVCYLRSLDHVSLSDLSLSLLLKMWSTRNE